MMANLRTLLVGLTVGLVSGCSWLWVRPVEHERVSSGALQPTCFTSSYAWPVVDAVAAALLLVGPILAYEHQSSECSRGNQDECSSTGAVVLGWTLVAPVPAASAYSGFRAVHQCRRAGSPSRWNRPRAE